MTSDLCKCGQPASTTHICPLCSLPVTTVRIPERPTFVPNPAAACVPMYPVGITVLHPPVSRGWRWRCGRCGGIWEAPIGEFEHPAHCTEPMLRIED